MTRHHLYASTAQIVSKMAAQVAMWLTPLHGVRPRETWHPYVAHPQRESHSHVLA